MDNKYINIMTSCDEKLAKQLPVLLQSIADNITTHPVKFFLVHRNVTAKTIDLLKELCAYYGTITFFDIVVTNPEVYDELASHGGGGAGEAYYSLCAHELLDEGIDRVLYLAAGDTLVLKNIDNYYFGDFQDKSLLVTLGRYKVLENRAVLYTSEDFEIKEFREEILTGVFNSGSYVLNLNKMRKEGYSMEDYLYLSKTLVDTMGNLSKAYLGDQGFLSAAYVGDIKYYNFPQVADLWYMPFDFGIWYFDQKKEMPLYEPHIVHFSGVSYKPWDGTYPIFLKEFQVREDLRSLKELKLGQAEYYYMWHEYAIKAAKSMKLMKVWPER